MELLRNLFSAGLKDNPHLFRGVLTGVRRVAEESLFSDLNNVFVFSLLSEPYNTAFGFTEEEVEATLVAAGRADRLDDARRWYDGYAFGGQVVYNPWSVLSFAATGELKAYWASASAENLIRSVLLGGGADLRSDVPAVLGGGSVTHRLDEHVVFADLARTPEAVWSFLLFAGYLKAEDVTYTERGIEARLSVPNAEVRGVLDGLFGRWLEDRLAGANALGDLTRALLTGDGRTVQVMLAELVENVLSVHETGAGPTAPERVYHAFVLGLLAHLELDRGELRYRVRSERESGYGRSDVLVLPVTPGHPGVIIEFKRVFVNRGDSHDEALAAAMAQIRERDDAAEARAAGAEPVWLYAIAFAGKQVWARCEQA